MYLHILVYTNVFTCTSGIYQVLCMSHSHSDHVRIISYRNEIVVPGSIKTCPCFSVCRLHCMKKRWDDLSISPGESGPQSWDQCTIMDLKRLCLMHKSIYNLHVYIHYFLYAVNPKKKHIAIIESLRLNLRFPSSSCVQCTSQELKPSLASPELLEIKSSADAWLTASAKR